MICHFDAFHKNIFTGEKQCGVCFFVYFPVVWNLEFGWQHLDVLFISFEIKYIFLKGFIFIHQVIFGLSSWYSFFFKAVNRRSI